MQLPWDVMVAQRLFSMLRRIYSSAPVQTALGSASSTELSPGYTLLPANASLAQYAAYFGSTLTPLWHGVGTAGMRRRDWGGVVDTKFRVYGTKGLRVVDASVIPMEVNGNPTSTIYALAEKAAEEILMDCK